MAGPERLQKILARAGYGSRRAVEELIRAGKVTVDGRAAVLGQRADPATEAVAVRGRRVALPKSFTYLALNKPAGYLCSRGDPHHAKLVYDLLSPELARRVSTVGRLDLDSEGLLLLTDDGELANRLTHPRWGVEKVYSVLAAPAPGQDAQAAVERLHEGVVLEDGPARPDRLQVLRRSSRGLTLELTLSEGRKREVRRMCAAAGLEVTALKRVAVGPLRMRGLPRGCYRELTMAEVARLRRAVGLEPSDGRR
jgi:pseudouridine synthase